jgi:uncharacterized protein (UPF0261 family)
MLDSPGGAFWDEAADHACFDAIRSNLNREIAVIDVDGNINDPVFADRATELFLELSARSGVAASHAASRALP